jgi:hypothetical protein
MKKIEQDEEDQWWGGNVSGTFSRHSVSLLVHSLDCQRSEARGNTVPGSFSIPKNG